MIAAPGGGDSAAAGVHSSTSAPSSAATSVTAERKLSESRTSAIQTDSVFDTVLVGILKGRRDQVDGGSCPKWSKAGTGSLWFRK